MVYARMRWLILMLYSLSLVLNGKGFTNEEWRHHQCRLKSTTKLNFCFQVLRLLPSHSKLCSVVVYFAEAEHTIEAKLSNNHNRN